MAGGSWRGTVARDSACTSTTPANVTAGIPRRNEEERITFSPPADIGRDSLILSDSVAEFKRVEQQTRFQRRKLRWGEGRGLSRPNEISDTYTCRILHGEMRVRCVFPFDRRRAVLAARFSLLFYLWNDSGLDNTRIIVDHSRFGELVSTGWFNGYLNRSRRLLVLQPGSTLM